MVYKSLSAKRKEYAMEDLNKIREAVTVVIENAKDKILLNMEQKNINASGRTARSFTVEQYENGVRLVAGDTDTAPIPTLEIGRQAGAVPEGFNAIIRQWIKDKGISVAPLPFKDPGRPTLRKYTPEERGLNAAAGAIAHKIATEGTNRHKEPTDVYSEVVTEAIEELRSVVLDGAVNYIKRNFV